jgi:putative ABC transport system permease protein
MRQTRIARNILLGVENLLLHKLRSFLTMLGVVFGVGTSWPCWRSAKAPARRPWRTSASRQRQHHHFFGQILRGRAGEHHAPHMSIYGLTYEDYRRVSESFANIRQTAPAKLMRKESRLRERAMELRVVGATPAWFRLVPRAVVAGRVIVKADQDRKAPVAVLTEFGARKLLATENSVGEILRIGGDEFEVIGIIRSESGQAGNIQVPDQEIDGYIPLEVAQRYFGDIYTKRTAGSEEREKVELHQIIVQVDDPSTLKRSPPASSGCWSGSTGRRTTP